MPPRSDLPAVTQFSTTCLDLFPRINVEEAGIESVEGCERQESEMR